MCLHDWICHEMFIWERCNPFALNSNIVWQKMDFVLWCFGVLVSIGPSSKKTLQIDLGPHSLVQFQIFLHDWICHEMFIWERCNPFVLNSNILWQKNGFSVLVFWCFGVLVFWCFGVLVFWCSDVLMFWCSGVFWCVLVFWCSGVLVIWGKFVLMFWCSDVLMFWCSDVLVIWGKFILVFWCSGVLMFWCSGVLVLWGKIVLVFWCSDVLVLWDKLGTRMHQTHQNTSEHQNH